MIYLKDLIESTSENRYKRIAIAQKMVIDRYLEPVLDACAELEYRINNELGDEIITDKDLLKATYHTNGKSDDIQDRIIGVVIDEYLRKKGYSPDPNSDNYPSQELEWELKLKVNKAIRKVISYGGIDTVGVIAKNIPLLRKLSVIDDMFNKPSTNN